ncbi:MAG: hypothetical protein PHQ43_00825 [Dehalococcoidales bacterium]|nr:hypothetical protein [Dehalococcoidales bacterium]
MARRKISINTAVELAGKAGLNLRNDYFVLSSSEVDKVLGIAKVYGYRKPKSANGSTARYFWAFMQRNS